MQDMRNVEKEMTKKVVLFVSYILASSRRSLQEIQNPGQGYTVYAFSLIICVDLISAFRVDR